jgi:CBS-domain-containing membrane protein
VNNAAAIINPETTLREVMTREIVPLKVDDTLSLVDDLVNRHRIRHFPVLDQDRLAGVVCHADLLCASLSSVSRRRLESPGDVLSEVSVKDVMRPAATALPETSIYQAARMMIEGAIECLIVIEGSKLAGIVSRTDLLRELARQ